MAPPDFAEWTKGQVMVIFAQGKMRKVSRSADGKVFENLRDAWQFKRQQRGLSDG